MSFRSAAISIVLPALYSLIFTAVPAFALDPTLEPIAADEPVPPAAFPPIPDRLNLNNAIAAAGGSSTPASTGARAAAPLRPTFHQGYGHVPAGAYMQHSATPAGSDSYNVNTGSAAAGAPHLPELPTPVTVSQSTTQDLSLPDDEFTDYHQRKRHSYFGSYAGNMLRGYMFGAAGMATGIGLGSLRY